MQIDGSHHPWLEDRGPKLTLLIAVDDATSTVAQAVFRPGEDTRGYLVLLEGLIRQWGIPLALYSDRHSAFKVQRPSKAGACGVYPVRQGDAGAGHPADLRPVSSSQGEGGADAGKPSRTGWSPSCAWPAPAPSTRLRRSSRSFCPGSTPGSPWLRSTPRWPTAQCRRDVANRDHLHQGHPEGSPGHTVKYHWRVLQLLPGSERPNYAGLRVDVLERADGELMIRYQGEAVDFQEGPPPLSALWGAASTCSSGPELPEVANDVVSSHLNEAQRERLAALESSDGDEANDEDVATRVRGGKAKPLRHQLRRTPTETQQARWEAVQQAREQGVSLRAIAQKLGMAREPSESTPRQKARPPKNSAQESEPRPRPWPHH